MLEPAENVDALDRSGTDHTAAHRDRTFCASSAAHGQTVHGELDVDPLGGGDAIAAAGLDRVEDGLARQRFGQHAGETSVGAECRGAGMAGAGPALVSIRVRDDADLVALLDRVLE